MKIVFNIYAKIGEKIEVRIVIGWLKNMDPTG